MIDLLNLYSKAPIGIQNLLTSIRGQYLKKIRYSSHTWETLTFLQKSQFWSINNIEDYQLKKLKSLISHATQFSPYYRKNYRELGFHSDQLKSLSDFKLFPIVSKEDFRKHNKSFISTHEKIGKMWISLTSGTTGTPLKAYHTHKEMQETMAFIERLHGWYIEGKHLKRASFTGKLMVDPENSQGPFHRKNKAINQWLFSSHHLSDKNLDKYLEELLELKPQIIDGIASSIFVIADYIIRTNKIGLINPSVVIPTSETLWPHIRSRIEKAFSCKVANQYGSQEGAPIAYECSDGGFHISPESGIFEILDPNDGECKPDEVGRLVVTSFLSSGTPLIRYDIGDLASWRLNVCVCGREMPMFNKVEGRIDDMFFTKDRGVIPRVDSAFKDIPNAIKATQVAQIDINNFEVRIIPDRSTYKDEYSKKLINNLHEYLGSSVNIHIRIVEEIKRTKGGKLRAMVNESKEVKNSILNLWNKHN